MSRSQNSYIKKKKAEAKKKKKQAKFAKRLEKKNQPKNSSLESMMGYVDEYGNISSVQPEELKDDKKNKN